MTKAVFPLNVKEILKELLKVHKTVRMWIWCISVNSFVWFGQRMTRCRLRDFVMYDVDVKQTRRQNAETSSVISYRHAFTHSRNSWVEYLNLFPSIILHFNSDSQEKKLILKLSDISFILPFPQTFLMSFSSNCFMETRLMFDDKGLWIHKDHCCCSLLCRISF